MYFERYDYKDKCWWCQSDKGSQEHKYKKSEIEREYGKGYYENRLFLIRDLKAKPIKSSRSELLKHRRTLCKKCNNQRSQPFDIAYDIFQKYVKDNQELILENKSIDFEQVFNGNNEKSICFLFRYFVKKVCCVLSDSGILVDQKIINFLNGSNSLPFIAFHFGIALDVLKMQNIVTGLQKEGHFSHGDVECILNKNTSQARMIRSYYQYRWFRISYVIDKTIPQIKVSEIGQISPLKIIENASTYRAMK